MSNGFGKIDHSSKQNFYGANLTPDEIIILTYHAMVISQLEYINSLEDKLEGLGMMSRERMSSIELFAKGIKVVGETLQEKILKGEKSEVLNLLDMARKPFKFTKDKIK